MNESRAIEVHGRRRKKRAASFTCMKCRYSSNRLYNIRRHEHRIHTAPKRPPQCCELKFESKADYYMHCEKVHPGKRLNLTSQKKYGIRAGDAVTELIDDAGTRLPNRQRYLQTRYMLRSLMQPSKVTRLAENTLASVEDSNIEESLMKSSDKTLGHGTKDFFSMNSSLLSLETLKDRKHCDPDYTGNKEEIMSNSSSAEYSESSSCSAKCKNKSQIVITEKLETIFAEPNGHDNYYRLPYHSPKEETVHPSENDSMSSGSNTSGCDEQNTPSDTGSNLSTALSESGVPITSVPSYLPLKKRILRDLALDNNENIEKSCKPVGDRLYCRPMQLEMEIHQISKQCQQSRKERQRLGKKIKKSKVFSMYNEAENVPPMVKITYSNKDRVLDRNLCEEVTSRHMDFLSLINFEILRKT